MIDRAVQSRELGARFARIAEFYRRHERDILDAGQDWGMDPYAWEFVAGITLTPIESALWEFIRLENAVLYPQYPVRGFFVDFGNPVAKVAIECDGAAYHRDAERDAWRQALIEDLGWTVYRIGGRACLDDDVECEDDQGVPTVRRGAAHQLIRSICDNHPRLRRQGSDRGPVALSDLVQARLQVWQMRASREARRAEA